MNRWICGSCKGILKRIKIIGIVDGGIYECQKCKRMYYYNEHSFRHIETGEVDFNVTKEV